MEVNIKATLCKGADYNTLYFNIRYKLEGQWRYRHCTHWSLISRFDSYNSDTIFKKQVVEKLSQFREGEVEEVIIEKVKNFFQQQKIDNSNQNEYDRLTNKYGNLKFKVKI